jgi:hypothetical protein
MLRILWVVLTGEFAGFDADRRALGALICRLKIALKRSAMVSEREREAEDGTRPWSVKRPMIHAQADRTVIRWCQTGTSGADHGEADAQHLAVKPMGKTLNFPVLPLT